MCTACELSPVRTGYEMVLQGFRDAGGSHVFTMGMPRDAGVRERLGEIAASELVSSFMSPMGEATTLHRIDDTVVLADDCDDETHVSVKATTIGGVSSLVAVIEPPAESLECLS